MNIWRDLLEKLSLTVMAFAIIGAFLMLCFIAYANDPQGEITKSLIDTLQTMAVPAAIGAVLALAKSGTN